MRNLIYFIYPIDRGNLRFNLNNLIKYLDAFDGFRYCFVALDENTIKRNEMISIFDEYNMPFDAYKWVENDPINRETAHFLPMLRLVIMCEGNTFYAHTKGCTRLNDGYNGAMLWTKFLYEKNLSDISTVDNLLESYACAGCLRTKGDYENISAPWHYSGTFFWLNNERLRAMDWNKINMSRWGTESYPGSVIPYKESCCISLDQFEGSNRSEATWNKRGYYL